MTGALWFGGSPGDGIGDEAAWARRIEIVRDEVERAESSVDRADPDAELADRIRSGDESAFELLFQRHYLALARFAEGIVGSPDAARDVVHDVLLRVWTERASWMPERSVAAYIFGAVRNAARSALRHAKIVTQTEAELLATGEHPGMASVPADGLVAVSAAERAALLRVAISRLAPRRREVILMRWSAGMRSRDIADVLGISVRAVENLHLRGIEDLRAMLGDRFP